jgi:hypothetical protein
VAETDRLIRTINALRQVIRQDWRDIPEMALTEAERNRLRENLALCAAELGVLLQRIQANTDRS